MSDQSDREEGGARVRRRFERARIEAQLFAEACDILLSAPGRRHDTPYAGESATRPDRGPVQGRPGR
jgi:hypothetical protein